METMTEHRPHSVIHAWQNQHDYLPAMGRDALLPIYDVFTRLLGINKIHDALIAQAELESGMRVLEIGCGPGNLTIRAKRAHPGVELIGSDPDPRALARAQRKARGLAGIRFERAYAQELPYSDGEFDRVLSSLMLHHLDDDVRTSAAAEIFRVLRPGGRLHLVDIGGDMTAHRGLAARWMKRNPHVAGNLGDAIPRLLRTVGFECAEVDAQRHRLIGQLTFYRATRPA
jgi:ubiquinone/menaquinone biosynthesis C-methylase UbiE